MKMFGWPVEKTDETVHGLIGAWSHSQVSKMILRF